MKTDSSYTAQHTSVSSTLGYVKQSFILIVEDNIFLRFHNTNCHALCSSAMRLFYCPIKRNSLLLYRLESWQNLGLFWPIRYCRNGSVPVPGIARNRPGGFHLLSLGSQTSVSVTNLRMTCCEDTLNHVESSGSQVFQLPSPGPRHVREEDFSGFCPWHLMAT